MSAPLILALPSKGRLKEQCEAWLTDAGFKVEVDGGEMNRWEDLSSPSICPASRAKPASSRTAPSLAR